MIKTFNQFCNEGLDPNRFRVGNQYRAKRAGAEIFLTINSTDPAKGTVKAQVVPFGSIEKGQEEEFEAQGETLKGLDALTLVTSAGPSSAK